MLIDLANHRPSFSPIEISHWSRGGDFLNFGVIMTAVYQRSRIETFDAQEALRRFFEERSQEGIRSVEESDLDRQLHDMDEELR